MAYNIQRDLRLTIAAGVVGGLLSGGVVADRMNRYDFLGRTIAAIAGEPYSDIQARARAYDEKQRQQRIEALMDQYDINCDGAITKDEVERVIKK